MHHAAATETMTEPQAPRAARPLSPASSLTVCPYCGRRERAGAEECSSCRGLFEPLSLIATQNAMGPWQVRDEENPHRPGCSIETLRQLIRRGKISRETVLRGPSTRQFWQKAGQTQGVAHLLGVCHACGSLARPEHHSCRSCAASFLVEADRNWLGLDVARHVPDAPAARPSARDALDLPVASSTGPAPALLPGVSSPTSPVFDFFPPIGAAGASPGAGPGVAAGRRGSGRDSARRQAAAAATIALCASVLSVAIWLATSARPGSPASPAARAQSDASSDATPVPSATPGAPGTPGTTPGANGAAQPALGLEAGRAGQIPATPEVLAHWRSVLERVAILEAAGDIESLEQAIKALREMQREAPPEARPDDLAARIDAIEATIDELTIKKFLR